MNVEIIKNEEVNENPNYITCEQGEFNETEFVLCKEKTESRDNTVMFLASQIKDNT